MLRLMRRQALSRSAPLYRDGPLRIRQREEIRYATGKCVLGGVLVACSAEGIVSIIVGSGAMAELRSRFPEATLRRDHDLQSAAATTAAYIAAPVDRFALALDLRGTAFQQRVWREVRKIPFGQTSTYSKIAEAIGAPGAVRAVAGACARSWWSFAVPCHRVLHKGGEARDPNGRRRLRWLAYEAGVRRRGATPLTRRNGRPPDDLPSR